MIRYDFVEKLFKDKYQNYEVKCSIIVSKNYTYHSIVNGF